MIKVQVMRFNQECEVSFDAHCLCATDRKRLSQMRSAASRERFLLTRKMLYRVLSEETSLDQSALSIGMGLYGKPYLESPPQFIDFSLSHCREFLTIATRLMSMSVLILRTDHCVGKHQHLMRCVQSMNFDSSLPCLKWTS